MNPFLDSLCNFGFKNIGLTPGVPKRCFQHPQDVVYIRQTKNEINKNTFFLGVKKWMNKTLSMIFYQSAHCAQQPPISRCLRYLVRTKRCDCCLQCLNSVIKWVSNWEVKFYNIFTRKNICYCFFEKYGKQCTQINKVC